MCLPESGTWNGISDLSREQVSAKHLKGGRETKMDLMVMENLFYKRSISRIYDLKGSSRSRYNPNTTGTNNVLLDMNLLETLRTNPIFLGSKAKRRLERAVWNDTSFLAVSFFCHCQGFYFIYIHSKYDEVFPKWNLPHQYP